ncbi:MAG: thiamine pyrophosphate-binding protein [Planctomycetota bacterium]
MANMDGGALIGRVLKEQNVKYLFSVNGGHVFPILGNLREHGIKLIHMRHEQATAYAADGYARTSGNPGVLCVTAGCGLTNAVTGLCVAGLTGSPIVCLSGQHPTLEDGIGSFQEAYGSDICRSFMKYTKRVIDWPRISVDVRAAFREAMTPPQGPSLVEIPANILYQAHDDVGQFPGAKYYNPDDLRSLGDPRHIDKVVELLEGAERPLLVGGDGIFWSGASKELQDLAELTNTPVYTRRAGQGAVSEDHPLAIRGAFKKPFTGKADLVIAIGFRFWSGEKFGQAPTWSHTAKFVQIDSCASRVGTHVAAEVPIVGDPKLVLGQIIAKIKEQKLDFSSRKSSNWVKAVGEAKKNYDAALEERAGQTKDRVPVHPDRLLKDLTSVIDKDASIIQDSFTLSGYVSHWFTARFAGQVVDAGPLGAGGS